ncbi:MAG: hypothetical protein ABSB67_22060 [Bryobacteraceae bacterium]|jgi:hypothetical protein
MPGIREFLATATPQLIADLTLYPTGDGGKKLTAQPGYGCPCTVSKTSPPISYDGWPLLKEPMNPGESRRVGFVFLSGEEAAAVFRKAGVFYLWEGRFIGEAVVVPPNG